MKIGLISDIHGNSLALAAVLAVLKDEVDQILFLGDLCGYYPFVDECISLWDENRIVGVCGNHDQVFLDCLQSGTQPSSEYEAQFGSALRRTLQNLSPSSVSFLQSLPLSRTLAQKGVTIALYHGSPWNPLEGRVYPDYDNWGRFGGLPSEVILLGHTHHQVVKNYQEKLIINPGSVGQPRDRSGEACFAILDMTSGIVQQRRVPFDPRRVIEDAREHDPNFPYLVEVLIR
jgi:putative phosphoesterase